MEGYDLGMYPLQRTDGIDLYSGSSGEGRVPGNSGGTGILLSRGHLEGPKKRGEVVSNSWLVSP